jgi:threo-3-hydroxy-L-aspartate ammonia-lyase
MPSTTVRTPLIRLGNLFPNQEVYAKCEFIAPSGSFKIRGAAHLLEHLTAKGGTTALVVPSMGNTALGAAVGAQAFGFSVVAVVPTTLGRGKEEKLRALGVELIKIPGGGSDLLRHAVEIAREREGYFVHPHLDPLWTDGYQAIAREVLEDLPKCGSLVFPVGGGGLLMGLTEHLSRHPVKLRLVGCEAFNYPTYARFDHARSRTIADGLVLEMPHPSVQARIQMTDIRLELVTDEEIRVAMKDLYRTHALLVEPSSAITVAYLQAHLKELPQPTCVLLTGENIAREDFFESIGEVPNSRA